MSFVGMLSGPITHPSRAFSGTAPSSQPTRHLSDSTQDTTPPKRSRTGEAVLNGEHLLTKKDAVVIYDRLGSLEDSVTNMNDSIKTILSLLENPRGGSVATTPTMTSSDGKTTLKDADK